MEHEAKVEFRSANHSARDSVETEEGSDPTILNRDKIRQARIRDAFVRSHGLTTIELRGTILIEPGDKTYGSRPFEELFSILHEEAELKGINPRFVWMTTDSNPLRTVFTPLKSRNDSLFSWIVNNACLADIHSPNGASLLIGLRREIRERGLEEPVALAATLSDIAKAGSEVQYDAFYGLSLPGKPTDPQLCYAQFSSSENWIDNIVQKMHNIHQEVLDSHVDLEKNETYQYLSRIGISMKPLRSIFS